MRRPGPRELSRSLISSVLTHALAVAASVAYAALADGIKGGDYIRNSNKARPVGPAADPAHGPQLWALSEKALAQAAGGRPQVVPPQAATMC